MTDAGVFAIVVMWAAVWGGLCAAIAHAKNRNAGTGFIAGMFLGFIPAIYYAAVPTLSDDERAKIDPGFAVKQKRERGEIWKDENGHIWVRKT